MFADIDKKTRADSYKLLAACSFMYIISICIKMVYSAEMAEIITAVASDKPSVSLGLLFYYMAYASAQLIFAFLISKINLKWFLAVTVSLTAVSFGMMMLAGELWHLYLILFLNGFFQVGIWGGVMFFVGRYIPAKMSGFASNILAAGLPIGTALTYGASAFFISVASWRYTFLFFSVLSAVSVIVFLVSVRHAARNLSFVFEEKLRSHRVLNNSEARGADEGAGKKKHKVLLMVAFFSVYCVLTSCVYYALTGWFPSLLIENFSMPTEFSILITLLLPLFTTPSSIAIIKLNQRTKSDYTVLIASSALITVLALLLCFTYGLNIVLTVISAVALMFFLRGATSLVTVYYPLKYSGVIEAGRFSLILNAFASVAAGIMPYAISLVLERTGWLIYFVILAVICAATFLMVLAARIKERVNGHA